MTNYETNRLRRPNVPLELQELEAAATAELLANPSPARINGRQSRSAPQENVGEAALLQDTVEDNPRRAISDLSAMITADSHFAVDSGG